MPTGQVLLDLTALLGQVLCLALCDLAELSPELKCDRAYVVSSEQ